MSGSEQYQAGLITTKAMLSKAAMRGMTGAEAAQHKRDMRQAELDQQEAQRRQDLLFQRYGLQPTQRTGKKRSSGCFGCCGRPKQVNPYGY